MLCARLGQYTMAGQPELAKTLRRARAALPKVGIDGGGRSDQPNWLPCEWLAPLV